MRALAGNVLIKMDTRQKEKYDLGEGKLLHISKGYDFNLRQDRCSMGFCLYGKGIVVGAKLLVHHLSSEKTYEVMDEDFLTDEERKEGYKIFSIGKDMCFAFNDGSGWQPYDDFIITSRIYKPYIGHLTGITPQLVKNRMFVIKGVHEGNAICVTTNSDYQIIFHDTDHKEYSLIRTRHREILAIDQELTDEIKEGDYLIGITTKDAKKYEPNNRNI